MDSYEAVKMQAFVYLRNIAVDNTMSVIHNKVIQLLVGNVIERAVFARKHHTVISTHLLK